jgi:salicylate hydroxylase
MDNLDEETKALARDTTIYTGPKRHVLTYPIGANFRTLNIVAFIPEAKHKDESWTSQGSLEDLQLEVAGWDPQIQRTVKAWKSLGDTTMKQALYEHTPLEKWTDQHLVVMGDAAHAMLPHQGQGTGQAIEDAITLALCLQGANAENIEKHLAYYVHLRKERTDRVVNTSRDAGRLASNSNPEERGEADVEAMKKRWQWMWKHDPVEAFEAEKASWLRM